MDRKPEAEGYVVYALTDPRDGLIHYVGQTGNLEGRLASHTSEGRRVVPHPMENPRKCEWLRDLRREGLDFGVCILERCDAGWEVCAAEKGWIETGLVVGWPLTNRPLSKKKRRPLVASPSLSSGEVGR